MRDLGDRMKRYEHPTKLVLPRRTYTVLRVDGRAFHSYLRGAAKPYDFEFMEQMDRVAAELCKEVAGSVFAYAQSDEVSILLVDFGQLGTEPWFGGEVQKMVSVAAATASVALASLRPGRPTFDARVFTLSDPVEVANYFVWRQRDAVRNSITMAAQAQFSHKRLHGVNSGQMQDLLWSERQINWNDYPATAKRGRIVARVTGQREVTFTHKHTKEEQTITALRSWWEAVAAPHFTLDPTGYLAQAVPSLPKLAAPMGDQDYVKEQRS